MLYSSDEFAQLIKKKYPEYADINNKELTKKVLAKYPEYKDVVRLEKPKPTIEVPIGKPVKGFQPKLFFPEAPPITRLPAPEEFKTITAPAGVKRLIAPEVTLEEIVEGLKVPSRIAELGQEITEEAIQPIAERLLGRTGGAYTAGTAGLVPRLGLDPFMYLPLPAMRAEWLARYIPTFYRTAKTPLSELIKGRIRPPIGGRLDITLPLEEPSVISPPSKEVLNRLLEQEIKATRLALPSPEMRPALPSPKVELTKETPEALLQEARKYKSAEEFVRQTREPIFEPEDILGNKQILIKIAKTGSPSFKRNKYPYEYSIEDNKIKFYHSVTGREIGETDLKLNNLTNEKLLPMVNDLKKSLIAENIAYRINNHTIRIGEYENLVNTLIDLIGKENAERMIDKERFISSVFERYQTKSQLTDIWNKAHQQEIKPPEPTVTETKPPISEEGKPKVEIPKTEIKPTEEPYELTIAPYEKIKQADKAIQEIEKEIKQTIEETKGHYHRWKEAEKAKFDWETSTIKQVKDRGGIKPYKTDILGKIPEYEEYKALPLTVKNKKGLPADEMADELGFENSHQLFQKLKQEEMLRKEAKGLSSLKMYTDEATSELIKAKETLLMKKQRFIKEKDLMATNAQKALVKILEAKHHLTPIQADRLNKLFTGKSSVADFTKEDVQNVINAYKKIVPTWRGFDKKIRVPRIDLTELEKAAGIVKRVPLRPKEEGFRTAIVSKEDFEMLHKMAEKPLVPRIEERKIVNPIRTFEEMAEPTKKMFYYPIRYAEDAIAKETKALNKEFAEIKAGLGYKNSERIMQYALGQEEDGRELLKWLGKDIPTLTEKEMKTYEWMRARFDEFFDRLNEARKYAGKEPIKKRANYFTHIRQLNALEEMGFNIGFEKNIDDLLSKGIHLNAPSFKYAIPRTGAKIKIEMDAFNVFNKYANQALKHIHLTPPIAKGRLFLSDIVDPTTLEKFRYADKDPLGAKWLTEYLDFQAGQRITSGLPKIVEKGLDTLNKNLIYAILSYNLRSVGIQTTAYVNTTTEIGVKYAIEGVKSLLNPTEGINFALKHSKVLNAREFETVVKEALDTFSITGYWSGQLQRAKQTIAQAGIAPLKLLDMHTAGATWLGAYKKAIAEKIPNPIDFADDIVVRTQGSAAKSDLAPIQRTTLGKTLTLFQTFAINNWGFLTRDVAGIGKTTPMSNTEKMKKIMLYISGATLVNILYEDILGITSPFPNPVKAFRDKLKEGKNTEVVNTLRALSQAGKETLEVLPGPGGAIRYGSHILGAPAEVIGKVGLKIGKPEQVRESWLELGTKVAGIPGAAQIEKTWRGTTEKVPKRRGRPLTLQEFIQRELIGGKVKFKSPEELLTLEGLRNILFGPKYPEKKEKKLTPELLEEYLRR